MVQVLNLGFVELIDVMGDPTAIAKAARISYRNFNLASSPENDLKLVTRLYKDEHMSPFEMVQTLWHVKAPRFVVQQWERHRAASYNEESQRYKAPAMDFFTPDKWRLQDQTNKQGSSDLVLEGLNEAVLNDYHRDALHSAQLFYDKATEFGVSRELARIDLPLGIYSEFVTSVNLRNLIHFFHLRRDPHAQYEIRVYADAMYDLLCEGLHSHANGFKELFEALDKIDLEGRNKDA